MEYIGSVRVGLNDIKSIINIENFRRDAFSPLLNMRGNDNRHLERFLNDWKHDFFIDISRLQADVMEGLIAEQKLHEHRNGFENKRSFFSYVQKENPHAIPVVSWVDSDPQRDVIQSAILLEREFDTIAIRVTATPTPTRASWGRLKSILDAVARPDNTIIIIDFLNTKPGSAAPGSAFHSSLGELDSYSVKGICLLSSSFPLDKPASNTSRTVPCEDISWQSAAKALPINSKLIYGDYASTNPEAVMDYTPGMAVLPFACYYANAEWWQKRKGGDKEFFNYIDLAREILSLPFYHGDDFCWATKEYSRIAALGAGATRGYGSNGPWNGYRMNQHICAMLDQLTKPTVGREDEDEDLIGV